MNTTASAAKHADHWELEIRLGKDDLALLEGRRGIQVVVSGDDAEKTLFNVVIHPTA
jgi:hypothetical protein